MYLGLIAPPAWLRTDAILGMFEDQVGGYRTFLEAEVDDEAKL